MSHRHPIRIRLMEGQTLRQWAGLVLGPAVFLSIILLPAPTGMEPEGWLTTAVAALMAIWWITEAIPIPATALVPIALFPVPGIVNVEGAAAPYANPIIFLFMGGFFLAQAMQRWSLHRRIALGIIRFVGTRPTRLIGGFMLAAAFLSMWVSNTATAVMMLPIGLSVVELVRRAPGTRTGTSIETGTETRVGERDEDDEDDEDDENGPLNFPVALMLGIAYACSIGGLATLIGTPPNALLAGFIADAYGIQIGFGQWMLLGLPLTVVALPLTWWILTRWVYPIGISSIPGGEDMIARELDEMGPMTRGEQMTAVIFTLTALAWITRPQLEQWLPGLSDAGIAIGASLVLFLFPVDLRKGLFVLNWEWAQRIPWEVLILFGGGLSLASAITRTELATWIGAAMVGLEVLPTLAIIVVIVTVIVFLTELTSNTASAAAFLPVLAALAIGLGENPLLLAIPAAIAASCAFMLPVATPPNAVVFGSSFVTIPQMARAGIVLNIAFIVLVSLATYLLVMLVFGVELGVVPPWATGSGG